MQHSGASARQAADPFSDRHRGSPVPQPPRPAPGRAARALLTLLVSLQLAFVSLALLPATASAGDGLVMTAQTLLHGRVRSGAWFGIAVDIENSGPTVTGELRVLGGSDGHTRFVQTAELATGSRKQFILYAQPTAFMADTVSVDLVANGQVVASAKASTSVADANTLTVGILADSPAKLVGEINLVASGGGNTPVLAPLTVADLPDRVQGWAAMDRLVWQDVDASSLSTGQMAALRSWVAGGGRLVIVGGTSGPAALTALPDDLLPYRPTSTLDIDPSVLRAVLGGVPTGSSPLPALAGSLTGGRALATSGDRVVAADMPFGAGTVTLLGFDPTTSWLAAGDTWDTPLWRRLLASSGTASATALQDDSMLVSSAISLPSLTLPGTEGLLALLIAYIVLIGPVNYIVLRVLDRREWAWATVPALIGVFTVAAFGIGVVGRGSEIVTHQVAIVHGAPGTDQASAQAWTAIFSPSRNSFQIATTGDTLLSGSISGDQMSGQSSGTIDVLEGSPTRVRDFSIGYGSVRTIRADGTVTGPVVNADLRLAGSSVTGSVTNNSATALSGAALVVGNSVVEIGDLAPGASAPVSLLVSAGVQDGMSLSDHLLGQTWNFGRSEEDQRRYARHMILDQLTNNPNGGVMFQGGLVGNGQAMAVPVMAGPGGTPLASGAATLIAWGTTPVIQIDVEGAQPKRIAVVLYEIPMRVAVSGQVQFGGDLLPGTVTAVTAMNVGRDSASIWMDTGAMTMSYRPLTFSGSLTPSAVTVAMKHPGDVGMPGGTPITAPIGGRCATATSADCSTVSTFPDVDVFDVRAGSWVELGGLSVGTAYALPDPGRWVDTTTGEVRVRFTNQSHDQIGWDFEIAIDGSVQ